MRLDAAFFFGADAMDDVATGWAESSGRPVVDLAYWDLVAALTSPIDLGEWLPNCNGSAVPTSTRPPWRSDGRSPFAAPSPRTE